MRSYDALRLAQTLYDLWFDPAGHAHDGYPDVYVVVDGEYREVDAVRYRVVDNVIEVEVVPDADAPNR